MMDNVAGSQFEVILSDAPASDALGAALATTLPDAGRAAAALHLHGELGAGKTTCARSLLRTLGVTSLIRSPTYTLVESYPLSEFTCVHVDLYRLGSAWEVDELDLRGYFATPCLLLIEWAERGGASVPPPDLEITLEYLGEARRATIAGRSPLGLRWVQGLARDSRIVPYVSNLT